MTLMKQAVEVRRERDATPCGSPPGHRSELGPFISQMYVHHHIYDLIFKYVGTMEASEVGSQSTPSSRVKALFWCFLRSLKSC